LKRTISNYDDDENTKKFLYQIHNDPKDKQSLETLYNLSNNVHSHTICAPDEDKLNKIINELKENGLLYDEKLLRSYGE
jgi:transcriptional regulator of NAD metabolism